MPLVVVIGGARSGKSALAEQLAADAGSPVVYVATAAACDHEMRERIARHVARRPPHWRTVEDLDPPAALAAAAPEETVLVDGLGAWLTTQMLVNGLLSDGPVAAERGERLLEAVRDLATRAARRPALTVVVHEEAGLGPAPVGAPTRRYLDLAGEAAQLLAAAAARVLLVVAGRALELPRDPARPPRAAESPHGDRMVPAGAVDFAVNVEEAQRPGWLAAALDDALADAHAYPDDTAAVAAAADRHRRDPEEVVATNGAADAFWLLAAALRPHHAVCVEPSFSEPDAALRAHGHPVSPSFRDPHDFSFDPATVPAGADLIALCNPNNPTGNLEPADRIAALCRRGRVTIVDEAFADFCGDRESVAHRRDLPGLVVVRSLTKLWGLAGVRAGYLLAPRPIAAACRRLRQPWSVNALALAAMRECCRRAEATTARAAEVARAREDLRAALTRIPGLRCWPSAANFLLLRAPDGTRLHERLLERGIAARPCATFAGLTHEHVRVAVRSAAANERLVSAIAEALA